MTSKLSAARVAAVLMISGAGLTVPLAAALSAQTAPPAPLEFFQPPPGQDISGVYWIKSYSPVIRQIDGSEPPYKPEALAQYKERRARIEKSAEIIEEDQARKLCTPDGTPRALGSPYPFEIVQTRGQINIIYEINKIIRDIKLDKPLPPEREMIIAPYYSGHSVAHWEGDTLVVESAGFKDYTFLDNSGAPHSDQLRTVERYRRINGGKELEAIVDIHDPDVFTKDWKARFVYDYRPDIRIMDWNCGEPHRDISRVPGVKVPPK